MRANNKNLSPEELAKLETQSQDHEEWDQDGKFGRDPAHAKAVDHSYWEAIISSANDTQITMRLPKQLLDDLKKIAKERNYTNYQKFVRNELIKIASENK